MSAEDGSPLGSPAPDARLGRPTFEGRRSRNQGSLDELGWGDDGILFGPSRKIADSTFGELTGWRPQLAPAADSLADLFSSHQTTPRQ
ncbi:MAG TPA: hypothetical protein VED20_15625 [Streptosporangiaceae bacterium]|nr:hypothetical protein [Streptosporangiaceae bacterium]